MAAGFDNLGRNFGLFLEFVNGFVFDGKCLASTESHLYCTRTVEKVFIRRITHVQIYCLREMGRTSFADFSAA